MDGFKFGLETEFILYSQEKKHFLWGEEINFNQLHDLLMSIPYDDLPSMEGIDQEDAHALNSPFVVEGFHIKDEQGKAISMIPKGVEIRTPVCQSIQECLKVHQILLGKLTRALSTHDLKLVSLSHHPLHDKFWGPQCGRRYDFWKWALEVMTTYGPDINISFPQPIQNRLFDNLEDFQLKINFYAPALTALSLSSPFIDQGTREFQQKTILSQRTFKRSTLAPMIEPHLNEAGRMEFKWFEMPTTNEEFEGFFLLCLTLVLSDKLEGRASDQERIYNLGQVSIQGLEDICVREVAADVIYQAKEILPDYGFETHVISVLEKRLEMNRLPAHDLMDVYKESEDWEYIAQMRSSEKMLGDV